jgi:hypothetical protein
MSTKTKYTATGSDGQTFTRTSVKTFTHAVIFTTTTNGFSYVSFAGSEELAHKAVSSHYSAPKWAGAEWKAERVANWTHEIVEVTS